MLNSTLKGFMLLSATFALAEVGLFFNQSRITVKEFSSTLEQANSTISEINQAAKSLRVYTQEQIANLEDPRNKKAIDAAIQTVAVYNATGKLINTQTIPRINKTLDNLNQSVISLQTMVENTDSSINGELLPSASQALEESALAMKSSSDEINRIGTDLHALLSDPSIKNSLQNIEGMSKHIDEISGNLSEASKRAISISDSLEKIAATSSKYRKAILLSQILSTLARAFF